MLKSPEILYVDDEANNLISFKATFRYRYQIYTAINTNEAREILRANPDIRIVFCDQRMPGEMGIDFRSEEHTSELQSRENIVCRLLLEKKTNLPSRIVVYSRLIIMWERLAFLQTLDSLRLNVRKQL